MTREQICALTSAKLLDALPRLRHIKATIGLDGFVDEIIEVVDKRHDKSNYEPVRTIDALAHKIQQAAGQSSNYELVVKQRKLGGNGPIMANALACIGLDVTYIGNLGYPKIHPVFEEFAKRAKVISIAEPGHTDALEFEDGKLMLGKHESLCEVNWDNLVNRVGRDRLKQLLDGSQLIGMVNWTMLPHMSRIWAKLLDEIIPGNERHSRHLFVDLADPEKRTASDILDALRLLTRFQDQVDVTLGLNLKESIEIADVLGLPGRADPEAAIEDNARAIRQELNLACVVIHPRRSAAAATEQHSATFKGPFVKQPKISTGAGDHFNAGFCLGRVLGFGLEECLCLGVATSGYYVRSGESPTAQQLAEFIRQLPPPQA
ncbi:MAG TPA: carbohydrate kinase family protein [Tepidisphaeraceae bacterium]|nr:carbohydrate kinase family protein [Tepidisphaeraceae bacterium]